MNTSEKLSRLSRLSEAEFRENLLIPLLRKMGYAEVRERHGTAEYGKDITFAEVTPLGRTYCAIVAKAGDISGAASGKQNLAQELALLESIYDDLRLYINFFQPSFKLIAKERIGNQTLKL